MKNLVVLSGLIEAQKAGNQSFKNTLLGLDKNFDITLLTMIPRGREEYDYSWYASTNIEQVRPTSICIYNLLKGKHKDIARLLKFAFNKRSRNNEIISVSAVSDYNGISAKLMDYANYVLSFILLFKLIAYRIFKDRIEYLYCYEVPACIAGIWYCKIDTTVKVIRRHQGTALTKSMLEKRNIMQSHKFSFTECKNNNYFIMANDGTYGDSITQALNPNAELFFEPNGVPDYLDRFTVVGSGKRNPFAQDTISIVSVCKHKKWKRVDKAIYFAEKLSRLGKIIHLSIVGDGPMTAEWKMLAAEVTRGNPCLEIEFMGARPHDQVLALVAGSDLFVSFYDVSNLGNPLIEANYLGTPIVTFHSDPIFAIFGDAVFYCPYFENEKDLDLSWVSTADIDRSFSQNCISTWPERMQKESEWIKRI